MALAKEIAEEIRRAVAFVAWRLITGEDSAWIFDHGKGRRVRFSGTISATKIAIRDDDGCEINGSGGSGMYTLTPGKGGKPVTLKIDGLHFEGFDYGSTRRYAGVVDCETMRIKEARDSGEFSYSVESLAGGNQEKSAAR